ncbi:MAG: tetratricopeptide repeat protein [Candidatus Wallbacteria bacterium]|nr:tetratricopeptide repeat protein [Candidatus Wallbacteria bacterium]
MVLSAELLFEEGYRFQQKGRYQEAKDAYEKLLRHDAANVAALNNLGVVNLGLGDYEKALECFEKLATLERRDSDAFFNMGKVLFHLRRFEQALKAFKMAERYRPGDFLIVKNLGMVHIELGQLPEAILNFRHLLKMNGSDWECHHCLARALYMQRKFNEALKHIEQARDHNHDSRTLLIMHADILRKLDKPDEEEAVLYTAYDLNPSDQEIFCRITEFFIAGGNLEKARRIVEGFLVSNPYNFMANRFLKEIDARLENRPAGDILTRDVEKQVGKSLNPDQIRRDYQSFCQRGDFEAGINQFRRYLQQEPDNQLLKEKLACLVDASGKADEALSLIDELLGKGRSETLLLEKGGILFRENRLSEARVIFQEILTANSQSAPAMLYLGKIAIVEGKSDDAVSYLERSISASSDFREAALILGEHYYHKGDLYHAMEFFSRVIRFFPDEKKALYFLGMIYYQEGTLSQAQKMFVKYIDFNPDDYAVQYLLSFILLRQKKVKPARDIWQTLSEISPRSIDELLVKARALIFLEEYQSALRELRKAEAADETSGTVYYYLGLHHLITNNLAQSLKDFFRSWQLNQESFTEETAVIARYFNREKLEILVSAFEDNNSTVARDIALYLRSALNSSGNK